MTSPPNVHTATVARRSAGFGAVFAVCAASVSMANLDTFVVNVALPPLVTTLHTSLASASWVLNAYAVIFAALLVPAGSLADHIGERRTYLGGLAVFTLASLACGVAPGIWWLVGLRVVEAAGAAAMIPASLGLLLAAATAERRMSAVRGWTAISGIAAAAGPALGGLLTQAGWGWVFLINVPIGIVAFLVGARVLPAPPPRDRSIRPDVAGAGLLTVGIGALTLAVVQGPSWGWGSWQVVTAIVVAAGGLLAFVATSKRHRAPLVPPALVRIRAFATASGANLIFAAPFAMMLLSVILWAQQVWHWPALLTGLAVAPGPLMVPVFAMVIGPRLAGRTGPALTSALGCVLFAAGTGWWIAVMGTAQDYAAAMLPGMLLTGAGVGLTLPTLIGSAVAVVPPPQFSTGSGVVTMARQLGSILGVAILVALLDRPRTTVDPAHAFDTGWWVIIGITALAALVCLLLARRPRQSSRRA